MTIEIGTILSDRYELRRQIARGGMSEVFEALDIKLNRRVAVKTLLPNFSSDPDFIRRFQREAQAAAGLTHPNIVGVYDQGNDGENYFIVMEFLEGRSLSSFLKERNQPNLTSVLSIALKIADALAFAHRHGIVHRDIKPGNVLITSQGDVKVTDFGIAHALSGDSTLTRTGLVLGTATYFSPEQAKGEQVDARSDLYSLGVVMYEMLMGTTPFSGDSPVAVAYKHVQENPPPLSSDIPAAVRDIVKKLLAKKPEQRFGSSEELGKSLRKTMRAAVGSSSVPGVGTSSVSTRFGSRRIGKPRFVLFRNAQLRALFWALILILVAGGISALAYAVFVDTSTESISKIEVTSVFDLEEAEAIRELQNQGLSVEVVRETNIIVTAGRVFKQDPLSAAKLETGDKVTIFVSLGAENKPVPDVIGQDITDARRLLESNEYMYEVQLETITSSELAGFVVRQSPVGGELRAPGAIVVLFVSRGPITVPNVVGQARNSAVQVLEQAGYEVAIELIPSNIVRLGNVITTNPAPNSVEPDQKTIVVFVSSGSADQIIVPSIIGFLEPAARFELEDRSLRVIVRSRAAEPGESQGVVVEQEPEPGTSVSAGAVVTIVVAE